jgi:hypothetical protein
LIASRSNLKSERGNMEESINLERAARYFLMFHDDALTYCPKQPDSFVVTYHHMKVRMLLVEYLSNK